ncbi:MAG: glycosyltransferase family 4 protein, partial [Actinomycetota bacterium]
GVISVGRSVGIRYNGAIARLAFGPRVRARVRVALRRAQPDVVHVHEPFVPSVSMLATLAAKVPVVATFHVSAPRSRLLRAARLPLRAITRKIDVGIAVSEEARRTVERATRIPVRVIPNGVDLDRYAGVSAVDIGAETVCYFGRLERRKGVRVLCEAFARIKRDCPTARLVVAGDGPDREACEAAVAPAFRDDAVFMGRVSDEAKLSVIAASSVIALPATGGESFGVVLLEAMAAARPVVATAIPGYAAVARDGVEALLVPPADPEALAQAVVRLMGDPALSHRLATAGRARAAEFDWDRIVVDVERSYADALGQASR